MFCVSLFYFLFNANASMNVEDKNLNDHINLLEIKLEKIYQEKAKGA